MFCCGCRSLLLSHAKRGKHMAMDKQGRNQREGKETLTLTENMVTTKESSASGPRLFPIHAYASSTVSIVCCDAFINIFEPLDRPMRPSISLARSWPWTPESACCAWKRLKIRSSSTDLLSELRLKKRYASERSRRLTSPLLSSKVVLTCSSSEPRCFAIDWMHS